MITPDETARKIAHLPDYDEESKHNLDVFMGFLKKTRPDVWFLMDLMDRTRINYYILFQVIKTLNDIATINRYGTVVIQIENGIVTFVRGEESTKVGEPLIKENIEAPIDKTDSAI